MPPTYQSLPVLKYQHARWGSSQQNVIAEAPVTLTVNGETWLSFLCTPTDLEALAVGFLYNEQLIHSHSELADVRLCASGGNVDVWTSIPIEKPAQWQLTSGCANGVTTHQSSPVASPLQEDFSILPADLLHLLTIFFQNQELYRQTRGVHASALADPCNIRIQAEDIGRHNTLDKIAGKLLLHPQGIAPRILISSGRISSEMMQKSARLGASIVLSRTSPSSHSVLLAEQMGITLIGYARPDEFIIYAHSERIDGAPSRRIIPTVSTPQPLPMIVPCA